MATGLLCILPWKGIDMDTQAHVGNTGLRGHTVGELYPCTVIVKGLYPQQYYAYHCLTGEEVGPFDTYDEALGVCK